MADGTITPEVTTLPLLDAAEAHRRLENRRVTGKLVLIP
ncbi:zinc-binding dehydrogenase [Actinoplanes sp. NPDC049265]